MLIDTGADYSYIDHKEVQDKGKIKPKKSWLTIIAANNIAIKYIG